MSPFESCGSCSKDGWLVTKREDGTFVAVRCTCWQQHQYRIAEDAQARVANGRR